MPGIEVSFTSAAAENVVGRSSWGDYTILLGSSLHSCLIEATQACVLTRDANWTRYTTARSRSGREREQCGVEREEGYIRLKGKRDDVRSASDSPRASILLHGCPDSDEQ